MTRAELFAMSDSERADWIATAPDEDVIALRRAAVEDRDDSLVGALAHAAGEVQRRGVVVLAQAEYAAAALRRLERLRAGEIV